MEISQGPQHGAEDRVAITGLYFLPREAVVRSEVATTVGESMLTVRRWRQRYAAKGVDGLLKETPPPAGAQAADGAGKSSRFGRSDAQREAATTPPTGASAPWRAPAAWRQSFSAQDLGRRTGSSRILTKPSSSRATPDFVAKVRGVLVVSPSIRPTRPWCSRSIEGASESPGP